MAVGEAKEIPLYIEKIGLAAHEREVTQEDLESSRTLSGSERVAAEARVRRYNLDIATYAQKINNALKTLSKSESRIDPVRVPAGITDPKLGKYLRSVKNTVDSLSESRMKDLRRRGQDEKQLDNRQDEARRMAQQAEKSIAALKRERERVERECKKLERLQKERARQLEPVKKRLQKAEIDLKRVHADVQKLEKARATSRRERQTIERRKQELLRKRQSEKRSAERQKMRQQEADMDSRIERSEHHEREHIEFRLRELKKIEDQLRAEQRQLREALERASTERKGFEKEAERLKGYQKESKTQLDQETDRLEKIRDVQSELRSVAGEKG